MSTAKLAAQEPARHRTGGEEQYEDEAFHGITWVDEWRGYR